MSSCHDLGNLPPCPSTHHEIWKYYQGTGRAHAKDCRVSQCHMSFLHTNDMSNGLMVLPLRSPSIPNMPAHTHTIPELLATLLAAEDIQKDSVGPNVSTPAWSQQVELTVGDDCTCHIKLACSSVSFYPIHRATRGMLRCVEGPIAPPTPPPPPPPFSGGRMFRAEDLTGINGM